MGNWKGREMQLVAFAVPYPPDYGGVIDVFYKLKALKALGIKVHLHAFQYKQHQPHPALAEWCATVTYYPRNISAKYLQGWPYVVASRQNDLLLRNIIRLGHPVLLEGLHTSWLIPHLKEAGIHHAIRMHNIEWIYYQFLASQEASFAKRRYFIDESARLRKFEQIIGRSEIFAISPLDVSYLRKEYPLAECSLMLPFHGHDRLMVASGRGDYALFHGNLGINENERAALWLIGEVFSKIGYPLIIAGKDPSEKLKQAADAYKHIRLMANPDEVAMEQMLLNAQLHLLPNQQPTGMKLKWVNALFSGRFVVAHPDMAGNGRPEAGIWSAQNPDEYINTIHSLKGATFDPEILQIRKDFLGNDWSNERNAQKIVGNLLDR